MGRWAIQQLLGKVSVKLLTKASRSSQSTGLFRSWSPESLRPARSWSSPAVDIAANMTKPDIQRFEVTKSGQDKRLYRALVLPNDLKVLLISDADTDKSAASLDVNIGSLSDPRDLPGLAHFCEHMLFMGTEKYPDENEYSKFLSHHGGGSNAYTSGEHTNYYFDVSPKHLEGAMDRFAQFFLTPLFTESATGREVKAVHSEHEKNVASDGWRLNQLEHSLCDPDHDYQKFGTGTKETLDEIPKSKGVVVRDELLQFHSKWYSSDLMALSVLGQESLDQLEAMVVERFCGVEKKGLQRRVWSEHPYRNPQEVGKMDYVVPIKDIRNLIISFPIHDLQPFYKTGPGHYLGHLVGHEGKGSLLSELKKRGWASSLVGGQRSGANGFAFFRVSMDLSEEGILHIDEIVGLVFEYLKMLKENGCKEWIFTECKNINDLQFQFKDKEKPQNYVSSTSSDLHYYPPEEVLTGCYLISEWRPELIEDVLQKLTPRNVRVTVIGQKYENIATMTEKWYGTKYLSEDIPVSKIQAWENVEQPSYFHLPLPNDFIPDNLDLVERDQEAKPHPQIIKETELTRVWFKQDDEFLLPKANLNLELRSPLAYLTPHYANMTAMLTSTFRDQLNEYAYDAQMAGLSYSLAGTKQGLNLYIKGYSQKQAVLLDKIISRLLEFKVDPERFIVLKDYYMRALQNFKMEQPHQHAVHYNSLVLCERYFQKEELLKEVATLTASDVEHFVPVLLSSLHIEALIHGNVVEQQALETVQLVEDKLQKALTIRPLVASQLVKEREMAIPSGVSARYVTTNVVHKSSCIEIYYQLGLQSTDSNAALELLAQIMNEPCFDVLRTKEQLGYIVWSGVRRSSGIQGMRVIVQSDRHPEYVEGRIETFLKNLEEDMEKMTPEVFDKHKTALIDRRLEKPKKLSGRTSMFWSEIVSQQYNFDRDNVEADRIREMKLDDILQLFRRHFKQGAADRKKLTCHVVSMADGGAGKSASQEDKKEEEDPVTIIEDPVKFKAGLQLNPQAPPFVSLDKLRKSKPNVP